MIVKRIFNTNDRVYEFPDEVISSFEDLRSHEDHIVRYRGMVFEWVFYDRGPDGWDAIMQYAPRHDEQAVEMRGLKVIGALQPKVIKCDCGAEICNHPGHSVWCDVLHKNGWDEAEKDYFEALKSLKDIKLEMFP